MNSFTPLANSRYGTPPSTPNCTSEATLANLGLVGSILIFCVGVNIVWPSKIKVLNMLPAIVIAPPLAYLPIVP